VHTPAPDDMLLQKLLIDTNPEELQRIANHNRHPANKGDVVDISRFREAA
jgi:hypothetical protein